MICLCMELYFPLRLAPHTLRQRSVAMRYACPPKAELFAVGGRSAFVTDMNAVRFKLQFEICNLKSEMNMAAQKDLLEAKDLDELKAAFKKWRRIGWKNVCKLWLEERTRRAIER